MGAKDVLGNVGTGLFGGLFSFWIVVALVVGALVGYAIGFTIARREFNPYG